MDAFEFYKEATISIIQKRKEGKQVKNRETLPYVTITQLLVWDLFEDINHFLFVCDFLNMTGT